MTEITLTERIENSNITASLGYLESPLNVTIIIPTLNEEKTIGPIIQKLRQFGFDDIIVVDGNSGDKTVSIARHLGVKVITQNGNGKGSALRQAFERLVDFLSKEMPLISHNSFDFKQIEEGGLEYNIVDGNNLFHGHEDEHIIVIMDADGSMSVEEVPLLVNALKPGFDVAKGSRFISTGYSEDMTAFRRIGNKIFVNLVNLFWSTNYTDLCYGFGAFKNGAIRKIFPHLESIDFEIEAEIFIKTIKAGLRVTEVPSIEYKRRFGKSNLKTFQDGFRILRTIFKEYIK